MADPMDIIEVPWQPGNYARRALVDAVAQAGKPWGNSWGRLKDEQQRAWDKYQNGTGSPADDPNRPNSFPLAHVRFVAVDVDATADNVRRLLAAGLVRPYSYEPWHFQLPGSVYKWPLVDSIPSTASSDAKPFEEDDMFTDEDRKLLSAIVTALGGNLSSPDQVDLYQDVQVVRQHVEGDLKSAEQSEMYQNVRAIRARVDPYYKEPDA